jgi:hypothetical protein
VYSLVNAPTVGFDLARQRTGAAVATVLLEALATRDAAGGYRDLSGFDATALAAPEHAAAWLEVSALQPAVRMDEALSVAQQVVDEAARTMRVSGPDLQPVLDGVTAACFGGLDDLLRLLSTDVLEGAPPHVVSMGCGALAAAYAGRRIADEARHRLAAPWITATRSLPAIPADLGPFAAEVRSVLDRLPTLTSEQITAIADAAGSAQPGWSRRMHDAAWAAYLSGRLVPSATVQFQAVRGLRAAGVDAQTAARGLWNSVSGCLQAVVLHDLLDEVTYGVLVAPWETAMGILG